MQSSFIRVHRVSQTPGSGFQTNLLGAKAKKMPPPPHFDLWSGLVALPIFSSLTTDKLKPKSVSPNFPSLCAVRPEFIAVPRQKRLHCSAGGRAG